MENNVKVHMSVDANFCVQLELECPACHARQKLPIEAPHTGEGFVCECGEEFPLAVAAMHPVARELEEIRRLVKKTVILPM